MEKSSKTLRNIVLACVSLIFLVLLGLLVIFSNRVSPIPEGTIGNTAGNLNNGGFFVEHEGRVFFANPYDSGTLYSMNPDESNIKKLNSTIVCNLLAGGNYIFYYQTGSAGDGIDGIRSLRTFDRCHLDGSSLTGLTRDVIVNAQLVDNTLYLLSSTDNGPHYYKMNIDKSGKETLADYVVNPACVRKDKIYFVGTVKDHALYTYDTKSGDTKEFYPGDMWNPVIDGEYVYYMDVENNYRLCRFHLRNRNPEVLTTDRVDAFNIGNGYIYYATADATEPVLKFMNLDGSNPYVLAEGAYTHISLTSKNVYFQEFGVDGILYHSPIGSYSYSAFEEAGKK